MSSSYDICIQCLGNLNYLSSFLLKDLINFTVGPCWLFIYLFFGCADSSLLAGFFSSCGMWVSGCGEQASLVAEHGL